MTDGTRTEMIACKISVILIGPKFLAGQRLVIPCRAAHRDELCRDELHRAARFFIGVTLPFGGLAMRSISVASASNAWRISCVNLCLS